jgi:hypothetical protein
MFLQMIDHYPAHPLTADAFRWLIQHNCSSETRRRHELGQFLVTDTMTPTPPTSIKQAIYSPRKQDPHGTTSPTSPERQRRDKQRGPRETTFDGHLKQPEPLVEGSHDPYAMSHSIARPHDREEILRWYRGSLELAPKLAAFGPLLADDPALQFSLNAARRNLGDFDAPRKWFTEFVTRQPPGPWRDAAAAELWLASPRGTPPKPVLICRQTETRPFLDGVFDDRCWAGLEPVVLRDAIGKSKQDDLAKKYPTKVWLAYDDDFLYLALRCEHPAGQRVAPVKGRKHDEDLRAFDRVSLFLDLDRDYSTAFHLQVDRRGCVRESCWGDLSWNPKWFVAVHSEDNAWQIEAAIPMRALTGDIITSGKAWACNVIRTIPGQGVQAWSLPAGVPEDDPRLEGMGLLLFKLDSRQQAQRQPGQRMQRAPE